MSHVLRYKRRKYAAECVETELTVRIIWLDCLETDKSLKVLTIVNSIKRSFDIVQQYQHRTDITGLSQSEWELQSTLQCCMILSPAWGSTCSNTSKIIRIMLMRERRSWKKRQVMNQWGSTKYPGKVNQNTPQTSLIPGTEHQRKMLKVRTETFCKFSDHSYNLNICRQRDECY